ncbi:MAG: pyridoxal-phosphate dependent enzyme [Planctomycetes bacterium]|nr:pyridoxal-phosphate dependent enzyme [Planctomycetota bacterium]
MVRVTHRIESSLHKLRGHLVATPLVGGLYLPGVSIPADLRIKAECLQGPGGIWFRGAMLELSRHFGALKGIVVSDELRPALAAATAARAQRIPCVAVTDSERDAALFGRLGHEFVLITDGTAPNEVAERTRRELGYAIMPGLETDDYAAGIATVGLELAHELPRDTAFVSVSPARLAAPIEAGLAAGGRDCAVVGVDPDETDDEDLRRALRIGTRIDCDRFGTAALRAAIDAPADSLPCAILAS